MDFREEGPLHRGDRVWVASMRGETPVAGTIKKGYPGKGVAYDRYEVHLDKPFYYNQGGRDFCFPRYCFKKFAPAELLAEAAQ